MVFFIPHDHFDIASGVTHALDEYLRAVDGYSDALSNYTCCYWEPAALGDRGWELIRSTLNPQTRRYADDYTRHEAFYPLKDGADPYFGLYGEQDSGFSFEYHARIAWRDAPPSRTSVLRVTLPTEYLEQKGADFVGGLALELASRLPFASGHAGLALDVATLAPDWVSALGPLLSRHPGFDVRGAGIRDELDLQIDGIHWMNFLGPPVSLELGGITGLRSRLGPSTQLRELEGGRVIVTLGTEPDAGDAARGMTLPEYRELAQALRPWMEPFRWNYLERQGKADDAKHWRRWWYRFLD